MSRLIYVNLFMFSNSVSIFASLQSMVPQKSEHVTTLSFPKGKHAVDIYFICEYINTREYMTWKCHNHRLKVSGVCSLLG